MEKQKQIFNIAQKFHNGWLYHSKEEETEIIAKSFEDLKEIVKLEDKGKWMLFYPHSQLKNKWEELCNLFDNNKLPGVINMKCSNYKKYEHSKEEGVIILYCLKASDEKHIMNIGNNLIINIKDYPKNTIYFKSDMQTIEGRNYFKDTQCGPRPKNYLYNINIKSSIDFID